MGNGASVNKSTTRKAVNVQEESCLEDADRDVTLEEMSDESNLRSFRDYDMSAAAADSSKDLYDGSETTEVSSCGYPSDQLSSRRSISPYCPAPNSSALHYTEFLSIRPQTSINERPGTVKRKRTMRERSRQRMPAIHIRHDRVSSPSQVDMESSGQSSDDEHSLLRATPATVACDKAFSPTLDESNMDKLYYYLHRPKTAPDIVQNIPHSLPAQEEPPLAFQSREYHKFAANSPLFDAMTMTCRRCHSTLKSLTSEIGVQCEDEEESYKQDRQRTNISMTSEAGIQSTPNFTDSWAQVNRQNGGANNYMRERLFSRQGICEKSERASSAKGLRGGGNKTIEFKRCKSALALLINRTTNSFRSKASVRTEEIRVETESVTETCWEETKTPTKEVSHVSVQCGDGISYEAFQQQRKDFIEESRNEFKENTFYDYKSTTDTDYTSHYCGCPYEVWRPNTSGSMMDQRPSTRMSRPQTVGMSDQSQKRMKQIFSTYKSPMCRKCLGTGMRHGRQQPPNHCGHQVLPPDRVNDVVDRLYTNRPKTRQSFMDETRDSPIHSRCSEIDELTHTLEHAKSTLLDISRIISNNLSSHSRNCGSTSPVHQLYSPSRPLTTASGSGQLFRGYLNNKYSYAKNTSTPKQHRRLSRFVYSKSHLDLDKSSSPLLARSQRITSELVRNTPVGKCFSNTSAMRQSVERLTKGHR